MKSRNSYTIRYTVGREEKFGFIQYYLSLPSGTAAVLLLLKKASNYCYSHEFTSLRKRIIPVTIKDNLCVISVSSIVSKCVYIKLHTGMYIAVLPNELYEE